MPSARERIWATGRALDDDVTFVVMEVLTAMCMMRRFALSVLFLVLLLPFTACAQRGTSAEQEILAVLISDTTVRKHANIEIASPNNVTVYADYISLHLFGEQRLVNNGIRSEVSINYPFMEHDTVMYEWEMMLPDGFSPDAPKNRWWVMAQWHEQPDKTKGETWDDFPGHSPPIALRFVYLNGKFYLVPEYMYTPPQRNELIEIELGRWFKMRCEIRWSQGQDGHLKIWLNKNEDPHLVYKGPNMLNAYQHYLKVGIYRHPDIKTRNTINLRSVHAYGI